MTTENNRLIAEFMGSKTNKTALQNIAERMSDNQLWLPFHGIEDIKSLQFHSDWNWLMQVIEKIESLGYSVTIIGNLCIVSRPNFKSIKSEQETKIKAVYQAVVEFVKWYNENK